MNKRLLEIFKMKKTKLLLLAFIGLCSFQMKNHVGVELTP